MSTGGGSSLPFSRVIHYRALFISMLVTLIVIIIFVAVRLNQATDYNFKKIPRRKIKRYLKTGDLLAISYPSLRGQIVKVFTGSVWAHVAMIVVLRENVDSEPEPYVLEIGRYSRDDRGVMLHRFSEWLETNDERIIGWRPYLGRFDRNNLVKFIEQHKNKKEDMFVVSWLKSMYKVGYQPNKIKGEYYCSEFITHLLQETGVVQRIHDPAGFKPWELFHGRLPLEAGHEYGQPHLLE